MKFTEEIILSYIDGDLNNAEALKIREELKHNKKLASTIEQQRLLHRSLSESSLQSPSSGFTAQVMEAVSSVKIEEAGFFNRGRLFVLTLIMLAVATTLYYFSVQFFPALDGDIGGEISLKNFTLDLQPAQKFLSSTIIFKIVFYVNGLVSLLLLDRAILKPYFARRRERYSI